MGRKPAKKVQTKVSPGSKKVIRERKSREIIDRSIEEWEIRLWKRGVPELLTMLAKAAAYGAETAFEFFHVRKAGHFHELYTFSIAEWKMFYLEPRLAGQFVWRLCRRSTPSLRSLGVTARWLLHRWRRLDAVGRVLFPFTILADGARHLANLESWSAILAAEFQRELRDVDADNVIVDECVYLPEVLFIATVWFPSMFLQGKCPAQLYRLAGEGDLPAACDLLRLDPFAVQLPTIQHLYWELLRENNAARLEAFRLAQAESVELPPRRAKFKEQLSARVIAFSKICSEIIGDSQARFDASDMWNLWDLVAKDRGRGNDSDELTSKVAFKKSLQRCESQWPMEGWDIFW